MRLVLTRHAKSSWDDANLEDHDRPLNARGRKAAIELGDWLASRGYEPEEVLCSTSKRTQETWGGIKTAILETIPEVRLIPELYQASPDILLKTLHGASGHTILMLAHNPGIAEFAASLPVSPPNSPDFQRYPTTATLVVDFNITDWAEAKLGNASLRDFFVPTKIS